MTVCDADYAATLAGRADHVFPALPQSWQLMVGRVQLVVWSRASARVQSACARTCRSRPMLAGSQAAKTAASWVVVLCVLGRHPLLSYPSLGWPRYGVVGRQDGVPCDSIIAVINSGT